MSSCAKALAFTGSAMGSFLLAGGAKGKRFSLPNSRIMIHQPLGGFQGQATDIEIHAREILNIRKKMNKLYSEHCNRPIEEVEKAVERDNFMSAEEALNFGLIDKVITNRDDIK